MLFRSRVSLAQWSAKFQPVFDSTGAAESRTLEEETRLSTLPDAPSGDYVMFEYSTRFDSGLQIRERVTTMRESDGSWAVSGYYLV